MKPRVLLTEPVFPDVAHWLSRYVELDIGARHQFNEETALKAAIPKYDGLLCMLSNPVSAAVIQAGARLKVIANHAVGLNNIDINACKKHQIRLAYTPGVLSDATADGTLALMLALLRRIPESQESLRNGHFDGWHPTAFLGLELRGATLGIIGMGRIGRAVAQRCRAFGMRIIYHNRTRLPEAEEEKLEARYAETPAELASQSDVISLHCPLTPETHHLVDASFLARMKATAYLINTSRGAVADEAALARALHENRIAGAGLDVFEHEPKLHPLLETAPHTVLTPHITSATSRTRKKMGLLCAGALLNELCGMDEEACFYQ
ncbi:MAG: 2-hydroxyacid dehydrogenase [Cyclonatronaceae bacterium]